MKLDEVAGNNDPKLKALLDVVADSIAYIGYEGANDPNLSDHVADAFKAYTGVSWWDWKEQNKPVLRRPPGADDYDQKTGMSRTHSRTILGRGKSKEALARDTEESDRDYIKERQRKKRRVDVKVPPYQRKTSRDDF